MPCSLKTKRKEGKTSGKTTHETIFKDEGSSGLTVNAEVEPSLKIFWSRLHTYVLESEPQTFK